jgi:PBP1b-binding outer membrane lipoprotein LpoB
MKGRNVLLILAAVAAFAICCLSGCMEMDTQAPDKPDAPQPAPSVTKADFYRTLAAEVEENRIRDTDSLLTIAETAAERRKLEGVKEELTSKLGIQPGKPKPLVADPAYGKQVAEKLRELGGG